MTCKSVLLVFFFCLLYSYIPFIKITSDSPNLIKREEVELVNLLSDVGIESTQSFYNDNCLPESAVTDKSVEKVTEDRNMPNIEELATSKQH